MIDLDAAMGKGSNDDLVQTAGRPRCNPGRRRGAFGRARPGAGRSRARARSSWGRRRSPPASWPRTIVKAVGRERLIIALDSKGGRIVVKGWQEATNVTAEEVIRELEPSCSGFLCTYVDKEGMLQGTDLAGSGGCGLRLRSSSPPPAASLPWTT